VQLSYVLPKQSLNLLPIQLRENLLQMKPEWYVDNCEFQWAFCKYFWEAHVKLPDIDIQELECIIIKSI
jgi:5'-3' exonuclease